MDEGRGVGEACVMRGALAGGRAGERAGQRLWRPWASSSQQRRPAMTRGGAGASRSMVDGSPSQNTLCVACDLAVRKRLTHGTGQAGLGRLAAAACRLQGQAVPANPHHGSAPWSAPCAPGSAQNAQAAARCLRASLMPSTEEDEEDGEHCRPGPARHAPMLGPYPVCQPRCGFRCAAGDARRCLLCE